MELGKNVGGSIWTLLSNSLSRLLSRLLSNSLIESGNITRVVVSKLWVTVANSFWGLKRLK